MNVAQWERSLLCSGYSVASSSAATRPTPRDVSGYFVTRAIGLRGYLPPRAPYIQVVYNGECVVMYVWGQDGL